MSDLLFIAAAAGYVVIGTAVARIACIRGVESGVQELYGIAWPVTVIVYAGLRLGDYIARWNTRKEPPHD